MTATNINIEEFLKVLSVLQESGYKLVDMDMLPDEEHPNMNKLVIHPVKAKTDSSSKEGSEQPERGTEIQNPNIDRDNNDIFNLQSFFGL